MILGRHDGDIIKCAAVHVTLTRQSPKGVGLALNLVSVKASVNNGKIDARDTLAEPKFIKDQSVGLGLVTSPYLSLKTASDVDVTNTCVRHQSRL